MIKYEVVATKPLDIDLSDTCFYSATEELTFTCMGTSEENVRAKMDELKPEYTILRITKI